MEAKRFSTSTESGLIAARSRASASDSVLSVIRSPMPMPAARMTSSVEVSVLPCTWMTATTSLSTGLGAGCAATGDAKSKALTSRPAGVRTSARSIRRAEILSRGRGLPVSRVLNVVAHGERTWREHERSEHVDSLRQPHAVKGLGHRHVGAQLGDAYEPRRGEKVEADILECVFHDLLLVRLDPDRHARHLVHEPLHLVAVCGFV